MHYLCHLNGLHRNYTGAGSKSHRTFSSMRATHLPFLVIEVALYLMLRSRYVLVHRDPFGSFVCFSPLVKVIFSPLLR